MEDSRDWLPANAFGGSLVRTKIDETVGAWAERWLTGADIRVSEPMPCPAKTMAGEAIDWQMPGSAVAVSASRGMTHQLLQRALDVRLDGVIQTDLDRDVTKAFAAKIAEDLALSLEAVLGDGQSQDPAPAGEPTAAPADFMMFHIADGRDVILSAAMPVAPMLAWLKANLPPRTVPPPIASSLVSALGEAPVTVEAYLGSARMSLADLEHLAPGDVVVLDARIETGGAIGLLNRDTVIAQGVFGEADGHLALTLTRSN
jgi:flagellar motor switch/type III secretory pathway protein FliN